MRSFLFLITCLFCLSLGGEPTSAENSIWVSAEPHKTVWASSGTSKILKDNSVQLEHRIGWQECTLYFRFTNTTTIEQILLECLPLEDPKPETQGEQLLFDVKPHLLSPKAEFTQLEFKTCTFLGNTEDDSTSNCIDFLTDTAWKVPSFQADHLSHMLVMQLRKPVTIDKDHLFGVTIDLEGPTKKDLKSRIRVSFDPTTLKTDL